MSGSYDFTTDGCVTAVREAIGSARIGFDAQSIHAIDDSSCVLYGECLARLIDDHGKRHNASEFVPVLESLGATLLLDSYMLERVLDGLEADPEAVLGCNLSADTLSGDGRWPSVIRQIEARKHLASRLVLEVIETRPLGMLNRLNAYVDELKSLGCRIAIDDFGSGYLTPIQLYSLNVDIIKLDAGFIWQVRQPHESRRDSLRHFVSFAASFAPVIVLEGVETAADFENAYSAGATHVQGWHLSRPATATAGGAS